MSTSMNIYSELKSFASSTALTRNLFYSTPSMVEIYNSQPAEGLVCEFIIATYSHYAIMSKYGVNMGRYCQ
jgi:hypothetical protein